MAALLTSSLGARFEVTTASDEVFEGDLFCFDDKSDVAVFRQHLDHTTAKSNLRFVSNSAIKSLKYVGPGRETIPPSTPLPPVNRDALIAKERAALEKAHTRASQIGVGVSKEAQQIFDALSRTYPCQWSGQTIIALDTIHISPPYTADACTCTNGDLDGLARMKRVLEEHRKRITTTH